VRRAHAPPLRRPGPRRATPLAAEQAARTVRALPPRPPSRGGRAGRLLRHRVHAVLPAAERYLHQRVRGVPRHGPHHLQALPRHEDAARAAGRLHHPAPAGRRPGPGGCVRTPRPLPASAPPARPAWARRLSAQACSCSSALRVCTASPLPASPPPARPARTRRLSAQARSCGPALRTATCLNLAEAPLSPALPGRAGCASLLARVSCRSRAAAPAGAARDSSPSRRSRRRRPRRRLS